MKILPIYPNMEQSIKKQILNKYPQKNTKNTKNPTQFLSTSAHTYLHETVVFKSVNSFYY